MADRFGRTIQLFLVDGTATGLRRLTLHGWTGVVFTGSETAFGDLVARDEVDRTGIYVLSGPDPERPERQRVYIGSGNSVAERVQQSAEKRSFWETATTVTTSDDDLSKGHAEYLEARLIEMADRSGRVTLDNSVRPDAIRRRLPEADIANMEQFLANLRIVLPVVGHDMLKPPPKTAIEKTKGETEETSFEIRHRSGVKAKAVEQDGDFIVLEGSESLCDTGYASNTYAQLKDSLLREGVLVPSVPGRLKFERPHAFRSPSAAAAVILDRNSNGRTEWKVAGSDQTYQIWQEARAEERS
ncbi:GIY-YIG nuclease family protein [Palleronia caenipelagi]|uniref:GIY-YIG nuclease family protein n=1 Tax=Palleronia caenipelagi TaxID=2489174 RepID=A0A547PQK7_9RHOB|nr:GIY-YIG nuclease family protein [Palleronia caenipelagi]TRD16415.1 GIY-YIG nuclease family protein [Palleronia caenipelagi]